MKARYHVHKSLSLVFNLSQIIPVHKFASYLSELHSTIMFSSMHTFPKWSVPFRLSNRNIVAAPIQTDKIILF